MFRCRVQGGSTQHKLCPGQVPKLCEDPATCVRGAKTPMVRLSAALRADGAALVEQVRRDAEHGRSGPRQQRPGPAPAPVHGALWLRHRRRVFVASCLADATQERRKMPSATSTASAGPRQEPLRHRARSASISLRPPSSPRQRSSISRALPCSAKRASRKAPLHVGCSGASTRSIASDTGHDPAARRCAPFCSALM